MPVGLDPAARFLGAMPLHALAVGAVLGGRPRRFLSSGRSWPVGSAGGVDSEVVGAAAVAAGLAAAVVEECDPRATRAERSEGDTATGAEDRSSCRSASITTSGTFTPPRPRSGES